MPGRTRRTWLVVCVVALLAAGALLLRPSAGDRTGRTFDADRLAAIEMEMWQVYYRREKAHLFRLLVLALREQFHYPWSKALQVAFYLARGAATFSEKRTDYQEILPDLERAFSIAREWMGAGFDPRAVATAELAWWAARRDPDPEKRDAESVGRLIGELYAQFYEVPFARVAQAGLLRAQAAELRDRGGQGADWKEISRLLRASYSSLRDGVTRAAPPPR